jgi:hypothetical protein
MSNQLNSGDLSSLQVGETLLTQARKVSNGKIQLEFAEKVTAKDRPLSALTVLNASDVRFSSGARRGWATAEITDASDVFDINFGDDGDWFMGETASGKSAELMELNILNPEFNNTRFRVRVVESTEPTASQTKYAEELGVDIIDTQAKRAGKGGDYILHNGEHIFMNSYVDLLPHGDDPAHVFLKSDTTNSTVTANTGVKSDEVEVMM